MRAKIRDTEIYFDVAGSQIVTNKNGLFEKPVLFLIHGGPGGNHFHFKFDSLKLQDYAQLIFIDQRGCGLSKKGSKSSYTLENNIEDIEALRIYLGLTKICVLGISYGGIVAQGYAIRYSKYIDKLILIATAPSYHFIENARSHLQKIGTKQQIMICEKFLWNGTFSNQKEVDLYFKVMDPLYTYSYEINKRKKIISKKLQNTNIANILSYDVLNVGFSTFLHKFNFIPKLKKISCPTLILTGKNDWICRPIQAQIIAENIPNSKLKVLPKCGHSITRDANEKYIKFVKNFLTKDFN